MTKYKLSIVFSKFNKNIPKKNSMQNMENCQRQNKKAELLEMATTSLITIPHSPVNKYLMIKN